MSAPAPVPPTAAPTARRSRAFVCGLLAYAVLLVAAFVTGNMLLDELAVFALFSVLLLPALRRGSALAWAGWLAIAAVLAWLAQRGQGQLALDSLPILINGALCFVFARTLWPGREPLIARIIGILEGPERLAQPGVEAYARRLTGAWACVLGLQACALLVVVACSVPDGAFARFGVHSPLAIPPAWRWYLHLGSYALVLGFLMLEYGYRRWRLRHLPHAPLPVFLARLARRWPALAASLAADMAHTRR
ncbi:MAG: xanthomonadin biosynthesis protein [Dokdonella sp.]